MKLYYTYYRSPLGKITLTSDRKNLSGLYLPGQKPKLLKELTYLKADLPIFQMVAQWLNSYFNGIVPSFTPPLQLLGTPFQQAVWKIVQQIPFGQNITYGHIARCVAQQTGKSHMSAQAVGQAVGHNPIAIIVPCHRVLGADGSLTGYAGGLANKILLLEIEGVNAARFY